MKSKAELETIIRNDILQAITDLLAEKFDTDILPVSASELAIPVVDEEGNEKFALVKVSIPRGTRNGSGYDPYDGYAAAEDYRLDLADRAARKAKSAAKKEAEEKARAAKREAKQVKKAVENLEKAVKNYEAKKGE